MSAYGEVQLTSAETTAKETIQLLLNLCEFMEREGIEVPIQSLCSCHRLASNHYPLVRDLFNYAFLSMWQQSYELIYHLLTYSFP